LPGKEARRAANAAPDIQQMHAGSQSHETGKVCSRLLAADVKVVKRRNIVAAQLLEILARASQRSKNFFLEATARIVCGYLLLGAHAVPLLAQPGQN
jgi:hypothetical protein